MNAISSKRGLSFFSVGSFLQLASREDMRWKNAKDQRLFYSPKSLSDAGGGLCGLEEKYFFNY
ncbi:MAG: hypothetical protein ACKOOA_04620 [Sediminibacterium sp.]